MTFLPPPPLQLAPSPCRMIDLYATPQQRLVCIYIYVHYKRFHFFPKTFWCVIIIYDSSPHTCSIIYDDKTCQNRLRRLNSYSQHQQSEARGSYKTVIAHYTVRTTCHVTRWFEATVSLRSDCTFCLAGFSCC